MSKYSYGLALVLTGLPTLFATRLGHASPGAAPEFGPDRGSASGPSGASSAAEGEVWGFDLALGLGGSPADEYTDRLETFGFRGELLPNMYSGMRWSLGVSRAVIPNVSVLGRVALIDTFRFDTAADPYSEVVTLGLATGGESFEYETHAFDLGVRGTLPLVGSTLSTYAQLELGPARAVTKLTTTTQEEETETYWGYHGRAAVGIHVTPFRFGGLFLEGGYAHAPVVRNEIGDVRNSGGATLFFGVHGRTWGMP